MSDEKTPMSGGPVSACCTICCGMIFPIIYFVSSLSNQEDKNLGVKATDISSTTECAGFGKIDTAWALILSSAALGTAWALIQGYTAYKGGDQKAAGIWACVALGPFICSAMILDIWINIPVDCKDFMQDAFKESVSLWTSIQICAILFIITLSCVACGCVMMVCLAICGCDMRNMATMGGQGETRA